MKRTTLAIALATGALAVPGVALAAGDGDTTYPAGALDGAGAAAGAAATAATARGLPRARRRQLGERRRYFVVNMT